MNNFDAKLQAIHDKITTAKQNVGRNDTVQLCAVSKTQTADAIRNCYLAGQTIFGENYLQEAISKQALLTDCEIEWHFIGPIQSNKTQLIAQHFDWVHSVDRLKIAKRLSDARAGKPAPMNICIQVNVSDEASKSGVAIEDLDALAKEIATLPNITLRGLMAIPAPTDDPQIQSAQFRAVREAQANLINQGYDLDTLSIGMSADYAAAIAEGATIVRIGTAIFGARKPAAST